MVPSHYLHGCQIACETSKSLPIAKEHNLDSNNNTKHFESLLLIAARKKIMFRGLLCYESEEETQDDESQEISNIHATDISDKESDLTCKKEASASGRIKEETCIKGDGVKERLDSFKDRFQKLKDKNLQDRKKEERSSKKYFVNKRPRNCDRRKKKIELNSCSSNQKDQNCFGIKQTKGTSDRIPTDGVESIEKAVESIYARRNMIKCNIDETQQLPYQDFKVCEQYDPHGAKKSKIEKDLDEALRQKDLELAEKISDEISERNMAESISQTLKANAFLEQRKIAKEKQDRKRRKLKWMFDHKERWELKGNM